MTTLDQFGLSADSDWSDPDTLVALFEFKTALLWHNALESVRRKEMIPMEGAVSEASESLEITDEMFRIYSFAGMMIAYDRKVRDMSDDERAALAGQEQEWLDHLDEMMTPEYGGLRGFIESALDEREQRRGEIEMLDNLFDDEE